MAVKVEDLSMFSVSEDPSLDAVDKQLEDFLQRLAIEGVLENLRKQGRQVALRRRESQDSLDQEGSSVSSLTETSTESDDVSVSTDPEFPDRDQEPAAFVRRKWLSLGSRAETKQKPSSFGSSDQFADLFSKAEEGPECTDADLEAFLKRFEGGESSWAEVGFKKCMDRTTETLSYASWTRDSGNGPTEYRSRMVVEDCDPETVRDFFLDDAYRSEWDDARVSSSTLEDWNENGCQVAQWIRRFPLFLRDREYVVSRRIWSLEERCFHCISKLTTHPAAPKKNNNPWRVSFFLSEWQVRPVEGRQGDGKLTACEIWNFHQEESGLPRNIARMGINHGMWNHVLKLDAAIRKYRASGKNVKHILPIFLIQADAKLRREAENFHVDILENPGTEGKCKDEESAGEEAGKAGEGLTQVDSTEEFQECQTIEEFDECGSEWEDFRDCKVEEEKSDVRK